MRINEISVGARVAVEPDQASSSTQHLMQPFGKGQGAKKRRKKKKRKKQNKKSQKYIHVTRDNRDDFKKIPVDTEFLAYTMKEPEDRPYDQVHPSIQGHIRKVDVPVGEDPLFRCAYPGCERQGDPFTNKENCKNHVEKDHFGIQFECPKP